MSDYKIIVPSGSMQNLVTNPSFETNTTGWATGGTNTIAQTTVRAKFGAYALRATYQDTEGLADYGITLTAAAHTLVAWVYIPAVYDGTQLALKFSAFAGAGGTLSVNLDMTIRGEWQKAVVDGTPVAGDLVGILRLREDGAAPTAGRFVDIDGVSCVPSANEYTHIENMVGDAKVYANLFLQE